MGPNEVMQAIGSVGFPIVAACGMFYLYDKTIRELTITLTKIDSTLANVLAELHSDRKKKEDKENAD